MYVVYPDVKYQKTMPGFFVWQNEIALFCEENKNTVRDLMRDFKCRMTDENDANIKYLHAAGMDKEEYRIQIKEKEILVFAGFENGFYYATKTLKQILKSNNIPCAEIEDKPDLKIRGFLYDISRNKVPKVKTVKEIIDIMSDLKMNHLELYVEGFSFEYKSFPEYLKKDEYISVAEYLELEKYAAERYIDLVPNQNGFGHMTEWLMQPRFKDLAELPSGMLLWGTHRPPGTLNPLDPGSIELVDAMYKDMLSISSSSYFNMNFDEPFELGMGKSKERCLKYGLENVYFDFVMKAYASLKKYNKTPLIWADVLIRNQEIFKRAPHDMIFVDWGYDAEHPFDVNLKLLKEGGVRFMAAPGTTSWCTLLTRKDDYRENIASAVWHTHLLGGEGILLTDWGDCGHMQPLPASFPPLVYAGLLSYRVKHGTFKKIGNFLNKFVFCDATGLAGEIYTDLGSYYKYETEYCSNTTVTFLTMRLIIDADHEKEEPIDYFIKRMYGRYFDMPRFLALSDFFKGKEKEISYSNMPDICKAELKNTINLLLILSKINTAYNMKEEKAFRIKLLKEALTSLPGVISQFKSLWLERNKPGKLNDTVYKLMLVDKFIKASIERYGGTDEK